MIKINHVYVHPAFENGNKNLPYHTDKLIMEPEERLRMAKWIVAVLAGAEHEGLNKPSWIRNGQEIKSAAFYKKYNVWHYHCGPEYDAAYPADFQMTDSFLSENNYGRRGGEVYHYSKQGDAIIVIGYSRLHKPFPASGSTGNPLRHRSSTWQAAFPKK